MFLKGIFLTEEVDRFTIETVHILRGKGYALQIFVGVTQRDSTCPQVDLMKTIETEKPKQMEV